MDRRKVVVYFMKSIIKHL